MIRGSILIPERLALRHVEEIRDLDVVGSLVEVVPHGVDHVQNDDREGTFRDAVPGLRKEG